MMAASNSSTRTISVILALFILTIFPHLVAGHTIHRHVQHHKPTSVNTAPPAVETTHDAQGKIPRHVVEEVEADELSEPEERTPKGRSSHQHRHREFHEKRWLGGRPWRNYRVTRGAITYLTQSRTSSISTRTSTQTSTTSTGSFNTTSTPSTALASSSSAQEPTTNSQTTITGTTKATTTSLPGSSIANAGPATTPDLANSDVVTSVISSSTLNSFTSGDSSSTLEAISTISSSTLEFVVSASGSSAEFSTSTTSLTSEVVSSASSSASQLVVSPINTQNSTSTPSLSSSSSAQNTASSSSALSITSSSSSVLSTVSSSSSALNSVTGGLPINVLLPSFTLSSTPSVVSSVSSTLSTQSVSTSVNPSGTVVILPTLTNKKPDTTGSVHTSLETKGRPSTVPLITSSISDPTSLISATSPASVVATSSAPAMVSANIFADPIATGAPPSNIGARKDHPVVRQGIISEGPIGTNKFYANMFLGSQTSPTFLFPYSVAWAKGKGSSASWGLAISHIEASQRVFGNTDSTTGGSSYYLNPIGIQSMVISAQELNTSTILTTDSPTAYSAVVQLRPNAAAEPAVEFPLVQGQAFITALYSGATPMIQSGVFFKTVTKSTKEAKSGVTKYKFVLQDGTKWILYSYPTSGSPLDLTVVNDGTAKAKTPFYGTVQIAKDPGTAETYYDAACGAYPTGVELSGTANGATGTYTFGFTKGGLSGTTLLMFALPHQVSSFDDGTRAAVANGVILQTTTKGVATAVVADSWTMVESMPVDMSFYPWAPGVGNKAAMSENTRAYVRSIAQQELSQDIMVQTDQSSVYFSGKALSKFANIIMVLNDMVGDKDLAQTALTKLKAAYARFAENRQQYPLVYESAWGGVVSTATYTTGNDGADFGNTYYNDHHFHYGYFIHAAAVIGHLDPSWLKTNRDYVNMLVRDVANPSSKDPYFPVHRAFDWYHGHSWAHGLYETADGKDQESSSEDVMHAYAIKMWGQVSGDSNMAARGNLQLAILKRALNNYYLYSSSNTVQPSQILPNKVAGILFENKIDHTTYFGTNLEYIQGIHMLPLLPCTPLVRGAEFVAEEWNAFFSNGRADQVAGGWRGILYGNYATIDPAAAYAFFSRSDFDAAWLDGGASLTWYLAYSAALAGL